METSPPQPPPKNLSAKKTEQMSDLSGSTIEPNVLDQYRKDSSGQYWFEIIPPADRAGWRDMVSNSIPSYFAAMVNSGQISDEINKEFKEYSAAVNKFLDEIN
tara:strand:- start:85 stop:393 length:309 start_codon:yes stop_codon:yes gene_type:complete